jgi:target of rapamycin complex 2 subunit MAPKAP1
VSYQLRLSYLSDIADGVGERLITVNDSILNAAPFKAAGWRPNAALIKRTHSPPIPTAIASEYFQAPRQTGLTLEDEGEEGGMLTAGGADTLGPALATKRRRRREQMEEDDSSDLSDESDDEDQQRAAQQIKFAKLPVRHRSGSSPTQTNALRQANSAVSPWPTPRRGSQSALETVKERVRRDTITSSEVSSENEYEAAALRAQREAGRQGGGGKVVRIRTRQGSDAPSVGIKRQDSELLAEEEEDSDGSDMSLNYLESIDSATILDVIDNPINASPREQVVGRLPRELARQSTMRRSQMPAPLNPQPLSDLPPPRPMSAIRPISTIQPTSLLSAALNANKAKPAVPFEAFASLSGQGDPNPIMLHIYAPFSSNPSEPYEVLIRRTVHRGESGGDRPVSVADLIGLSLWRYNQEKLEPPLPSNRQNVNWWTLRMVEEDGEVDDDFPPLERKKPLASFTTVNNKASRSRSNSRVYDIFALVQASEAEFAENQSVTPEFKEEEAAAAEAVSPSAEERAKREEMTSRNTPQPSFGSLSPSQPRVNPVLTTTYRQNTMLADMPQQPTAQPQQARGQHKLLRIHIYSSDAAPGQMMTLDVTTDMYLAEVLDLVCRKRQLDKANHVLKLPGSGAVVLLDRAVSSIGNLSDLELYRRRFVTDGPFLLTGSPGSGSPGGAALPFGETSVAQRKAKKGQIMGTHPLAKEMAKQQELGGSSSNYKRYTVYRKLPMRFAGMNERLLIIDGEYVYIMPASGGRAVTETGSKTTTMHFSNVAGCKVSRRHPTTFKVRQLSLPNVGAATLTQVCQLAFAVGAEEKRYEFEAKNADEAADVVDSLLKGAKPYRQIS